MELLEPNVKAWYRPYFSQFDFFLIVLFLNFQLFVSEVWIYSSNIKWRTFILSCPEEPSQVTVRLHTFTFDIQRATLETCDLWDIWSEWWVDMTWQFPEKMDSPRNKNGFPKENKWISREKTHFQMKKISNKKFISLKKRFPERERKWISWEKKCISRDRKNLFSGERKKWFPEREKIDFPRGIKWISY